MELLHLNGNTWYLSGNQIIPIYKVTENTCILLDTGVISQRYEIENILADHGLRPVGILGTHAHTDHSPNHRYFQKKYQIPVALPLGEAGISSNQHMLKAYYYMFTENQIGMYPDFSEMEVVADKIIFPAQSEFVFCGAIFKIIHTPGHSPDHISIVTPDHVLYAGDALLTSDNIANAKIPYFFSVKEALASMDKLAESTFDVCLAAHTGICEDIHATVADNKKAIAKCADTIASCIENTMTFDQILTSVCNHFSLLSGKLDKCKVYERNVRAYLEYLTDIGKISSFAAKGVVYYNNISA